MRRLLATAAFAALAVALPAPARAGTCAVDLLCTVGGGCTGTVNACPDGSHCTGAVDACPFTPADECDGNVDVCGFDGFIIACGPTLDPVCDFLQPPTVAP